MHRPAPPALLPLVVLLTTAVLATLPLLSQAPNRLLSGHGLSLWTVVQAAGSGWKLGLGVLAVGGVGLALVLWRRPGHKRWRWALVGWQALLVWGLAALAGLAAARFDSFTQGLGRTSLSAGWWLCVLLVWLGANEALRQLQASARMRALGGVVLVGGIGLLLASGALDALSSLKEYANRQDEFWAAVRQHLTIIAWTTGLTLLTGLPLGVALYRQPRWAVRVFPWLSLVQTVPSIALFGLLMAALSWLGGVFAWLPAWGIRGVGLAPAVLALTLYSLLPLVRSTYEGLAHIPQPLIESAQAMGMSATQRLWQVECPLAAPVILAGLKVMLVQAVGLTTVAALIGAGGLGSLMFEGLFSSALDLVVLAIVPIVVMAWLAEAAFATLQTFSPSWSRN